MLKIIRNLIFILPLILNSNTFAQNLVVDITEGNVDPLPIAIQKFVSETNDSSGNRSSFTDFSFDIDLQILKYFQTFLLNREEFLQKH